MRRYHNSTAKSQGNNCQLYTNTPLNVYNEEAEFNQIGTATLPELRIKLMPTKEYIHANN